MSFVSLLIFVFLSLTGCQPSILSPPDASRDIAREINPVVSVEQEPGPETHEVILSSPDFGQGYSYQWEMSQNGGTTYEPVLDAVDAFWNLDLRTVKSSNALSQVKVRSVVTPVSGGAPVLSAPVTLTLPVAVSITTQPVSQSVVEGSDLNLSVVASVNLGTLSYQWQKKSPSAGENFVNLDGKTSAGLTVTAVSLNDTGSRYRVIVTPSGGGNSVVSAEAQLTVTEAPQSQDCSGTWGGTASLDNCGVCTGGTTGLTPNSSCSQDCNGHGTPTSGTTCDCEPGYQWNDSTCVIIDVDNDGVNAYDDCDDNNADKTTDCSFTGRGPSGTLYRDGTACTPFGEAQSEGFYTCGELTYQWQDPWGSGFPLADGYMGGGWCWDSGHSTSYFYRPSDGYPLNECAGNWAWGTINCFDMDSSGTGFCSQYDTSGGTAYFENGFSVTGVRNKVCYNGGLGNTHELDEDGTGFCTPADRYYYQGELAEVENGPLGSPPKYYTGGVVANTKVGELWYQNGNLFEGLGSGYTGDQSSVSIETDKYYYAGRLAQFDDGTFGEPAGRYVNGSLAQIANGPQGDPLRYYVDGQLADGYYEDCYVQGEIGYLVNGTGWCPSDETYYISSVAVPGLDETGTGVSSSNEFFANAQSIGTYDPETNVISITSAASSAFTYTAGTKNVRFESGSYLPSGSTLSTSCESGEISFWGNSYNAGSVYGRVIDFRESSYNEGNAVYCWAAGFSNSSENKENGSVSKDPNIMSFARALLDLRSKNYGTIDQAEFSDVSENHGTVTGAASFGYTSKNSFDGVVGSGSDFRTSSMNEGNVNGDATFQGASINTGAIFGTGLFENGAQNYGAVNSNATFNNSSQNFGTVLGSVTFNGSGTNASDSNTFYVNGARASGFVNQNADAD
ncbi:MAG: immunoglobulin domain-containing protein, partial [Pseudomonadota bacterium]